MRERSAAARRFGYQPALDGVRAIAVATVLLFHGGFGWMSGGYVGVSVFFTLSGFLITSLALVEHERTGRLDVGAFYSRRVRRLMPASLACIVGIIVLAWTGVFDEVANLRRDVWAALAQVYNWVALSSGDSYAEVVSGNTGRLSPLDHYWSLAIEEQFYWVWPLVLLLVLRFAPRGRALLLVGATAVFAAAAPLIAAIWGGDAAYYATPARLAELLIGAVTALGIHERRATGRRLPRRTHLLAPVGLAVIVWAAVAWPAGSGPAYEGWLPLFAVASAALIVGLQVDGPVRRAMAVSPLVALGAISYGVYLYHWPVFAILDQERVALGPVPLFVLQVAVTLALAIASAVLLEQPIRRARMTIRPVSRMAAGACFALAAVVVLVPFRNAAYWNGSETAREAVALDSVESVAALEAVGPATSTADTADPSPPTTSGGPEIPRPGAAGVDEGPVTTDAPGGTVTPTTLPPETAPPTTAPLAIGAGAPVPSLPVTTSRPARVLVVGDSTASAMGEGLVEWAGAHPDLAQVSIQWAPGCGFIRAGTEEFEVPSYRTACDDVRADLPEVLASVQPDVVVLMVTIGDTEARTLDDGGELLRPGSDGFTRLIDAEYDRFLVELVAVGVDHIAWVVPPTPDTDDHVLAANLDVPERWTTLRAAVERMAANHPDVVTLVDLDAWEEAQATSGRADGLHYSGDAATRLADTLLAPSLVELALS